MLMCTRVKSKSYRIHLKKIQDFSTSLYSERRSTACTQSATSTYGLNHSLNGTRHFSLEMRLIVLVCM